MQLHAEAYVRRWLLVGPGKSLDINIDIYLLVRWQLYLNKIYVYISEVILNWVFQIR